MKTKKQASNKKKKSPRAEKRVVIFDHKDHNFNQKPKYFAWGGMGSKKRTKFPEQNFTIIDLITGEKFTVVSLDGRSLMERCFSKKGTYIINIQKQRKTDKYIPSSLKPKALKKHTEEYPELFL